MAITESTILNDSK